VAAFADKMRSVATVAFTPNLRRHVDCPTVEVEGATVREVLDRVFADQPRLRGYVVDERGVLRKHMIVFIDGQQIVDRERMTDAVSPRSELYVMQALSGG
jgi:sulfur-carrier protein